MNERFDNENKNIRRSIFVGVLHFGRTELIQKLVSLLNPESYKVCILDHNSIPLSKSESDVAYYWNPKNPGYAAGMNFLIKQAQLSQADVGFFLTNDVLIPHEKLMLWFDMIKTSTFTIQQPVLVSNDNKIRSGIQYYPSYFHWPLSPWRHRKYKRLDEDYYSTGFICGACFSCDMKTFNSKPVFFDEDFFMYYEDQEWSIRLNSEGHRFALNSRITVFHQESASSGGGIGWYGIKLRWNGLSVFLNKTNAAALNKFLSKILFIARMFVLLIRKRAVGLFNLK